MKEQDIQLRIRKWFEANGWIVLKTVALSTAGWPDLIALKDETTVFVEVKKPGGKTTDLQEYRIAQLIAAGFYAFIAYSFNDFQNKINEK